MAHQLQTSPKLNPRQSTMRVIAARIKVVRLLSAAAVALFLFVGTAHADIFVSNYDHGSVDKYYDNGHINVPDFLPGAAHAEGIQCKKLSTNEVYVAHFTGDPTIGVYNLTTRAHLRDITITGVTTGLVALAMNASATVLYAADPYTQHIWAINLPDGTGPCTPSVPCSTPNNTLTSGDLIVGPDGNVYATGRGQSGQGVRQFPPVTTTGWSPGSGVVVIQGTSYNGHSFAHAGAMIFYDGNLWVTNTLGDGTDGIFEFTGPLNPNPFKVLNFTLDANGSHGAIPLGMDISPQIPRLRHLIPAEAASWLPSFTERALRLRSEMSIRLIRIVVRELSALLGPVTSMHPPHSFLVMAPLADRSTCDSRTTAMTGVMSRFVKCRASRIR